MIRKNLLTRVMFLVMLSIQLVYSQQFNVENFISEVQARYNNYENFITDFTKAVSSTAITEQQITNGKLYYFKNNRYRLEINGQVIVCDGKNVYNYSKRNKRVVITKYEENFFSPENLFTKLPQHSNKEFQGEEVISGKKVFKFRFYPSSSNPDFKSMIIWISTDYIIQKIQTEDWAGNQYIFNVTSFKPNQKLSNDLVKFKIPAGVKVVDLR